MPPTASNLADLSARFRGKKGVLLYTEFQASKGPEFLARTLGWPAVRLPLEPPVGATAEEYLKLIDRWVDAVAAGK